jgi:hypothetical protein
VVVTDAMMNYQVKSWIRTQRCSIGAAVGFKEMPIELGCDHRTISSVALQQSDVLRQSDVQAGDGHGF